MAHDIFIRGGQIVDRLDGEAFSVDFAIADGIIAEIGSVVTRGEQESDAAGVPVTRAYCTPASRPAGFGIGTSRRSAGTG